MRHDISRYVGFDLYFDPDTLEVETKEDVRFVRTVRYARELKDVLKLPDAVDPETELYENHCLAKTPPEAKKAFERLNLTYSLVVIAPRCIGNEFVKTAGHYHEFMAGTTLGYPEIYTQLFGNQYLLLQKTDPEVTNVVVDCVLIEMTPGLVVDVPPGYAHVLINNTDQATLMAGLYNRQSKTLYDSVRSRRGLAYYVTVSGGEQRIERNFNYPDAPALRRLSRVERTIFSPPEPNIPLWQSFVDNPDLYAFLSDPETALQRYGATGTKEK